MCTLCNACQYIQYSGIYFSGIGLARNRITAGKAHLLCNHLISLAAFCMIALKQFQETGLSTGSSLGAQKLHIRQHMIQILQIQAKLIQPQRCPFSNRCRLCRLEVGKCQRRLIFIFICKFRQLCHHIDQFFANQLKSLCHNNNICVVSYIAGGSSQVNNSLCLGALLTVSIYMRHYIMTNKALTLLCHIVVDIICMSLQLVNLLLAYRQSQLMLGLCESNPESSPGSEFFIRRKNVLHFPTGITLRQGALISVVHKNLPFMINLQRNSKSCPI